MWRRPLSAWFGCASGGPKLTPQGPWRLLAARGRSAPAVPAGRLTALQALDFWRRLFEERGVTEPDQSSRHIVAHLLGAKTIESLQPEQLTEYLSPDRVEQVWRLCTLRLSRLPVQYVIEEWDFRDLTLKMRPPVFIPRPETEELVELVLADLQLEPGPRAAAHPQPTCLEVGCGSGAVSLSLLKSLPQLRAVALDQSRDAVELTRENAERSSPVTKLGLQDRLQLHHLDILKDAEAALTVCSRVSAVVSNPPYLFSQDLLSLEPEVFRFEDHAALDGGEDGLNVIKQILILAPQILLNHGRVYLEVDSRHPPLLRRWAEANVEGLQYVETQRDVTGRPRFCILQKEESNWSDKLEPY